MLQNMKRGNTILTRRLQNLFIKSTTEDDVTINGTSGCDLSLNTDTLPTVLTSTSMNYFNSMENINSLTEETKDSCYSACMVVIELQFEVFQRLIC